MKTPLWGVFVLLSLLFSCTARAQEEESDRVQSLFSDYKAHRVGDIVTIYIVEFSSASNSATFNNQSQNETSVSSDGTGALNFIPIFGFSGKYGNKYKGDGTVTQRGQLKAKLSARIVEISPTGMLKIEGRKVVNINGDRQTTILSGWVRPEDITSDNIVYSYNIADAEIQYKGKGIASSAPKPGLITRIINWIF